MEKSKQKITMDKTKLDKLNKLLEIMKDDTVKPSDIEKFLRFVLEIISKAKINFEKLSAENIAVITEGIELIKKKHSETLTEIDIKTQKTILDFEEKISEVNDQIKELKSIKYKDGKDGKDADEEVIIENVLAKIKLPEYEVYTLEEKGEEIVKEINALPTDEDEYKIDFSHIKNAPDFKGGTPNGGGWRNLYQLHDVELSSPTDNQVLTYDSATNTWKNENATGGGTIDGSGTTNELTYWVDSNTVGALAVATYPSLTEISYVKGVTSAIQTQLNTKLTSSNIVETITNGVTTNAPSENAVFDALALKEPLKGADDNYVTDAQLVVIGNTSGTNTGDQDLSGLAVKSGALTQFVGNGNWKVWYSDGSGDVQELALGADGTFLKSNGAAIAPSFATPAGSGDVSKVGTPVNNQVGVWTGDGTLEGDADLTFDTATNTLATGIVTVSDDAYGAGWNGSTAVPTKNALYDKIETITAGTTIDYTTNFLFMGA